MFHYVTSAHWEMRQQKKLAAYLARNWCKRQSRCALCVCVCTPTFSESGPWLVLFTLAAAPAAPVEPPPYNFRIIIAIIIKIEPRDIVRGAQSSAARTTLDSGRPRQTRMQVPASVVCSKFRCYTQRCRKEGSAFISVLCKGCCHDKRTMFSYYRLYCYCFY
jgi:hypothetical protein